jgi:Protein of unknown function (DUF3455)
MRGQTADAEAGGVRAGTTAPRAERRQNQKIETKNETNPMSYIDPKYFVTLTRGICGALVLASALGSAYGQNLTTPATPAIITPPAGNVLFLVASAVGTQGYICLPTSAGAATASWTVKSSRPQATLFQRVFGQDVQIATHFLSPGANPNDAAPNPLPFGSATWQSSFDTSKVWAQVLNSNSIPAGSGASCPNAGSIPCLILQSIGAQPGPMGGTILSRTTFIQRLNTRGGVAPADGCSTQDDAGRQTLVSHSADYYFYRRDK